MAESAVQLASCKCRSAWCHNEYCRSRAVDRLFEGGRTGSPEDWDWRCVRHFWITIDRDLYEDGEDAYVSTRDRISYVMQRIRDSVSDRGIVVRDYFKVLEWHKDGFPHWHFFVLTNKRGRSAQIGYDTINAAWGAGLVQENYIHDASHWEAIAGYQAKRGYIGKAKDHQVTLPSWAMEWESGRIRKGSRAHRSRTSSGSEDGESENSTEEKDMNSGDDREERRTYKAMLEDCDEGSRLLSLGDGWQAQELPWSAQEVRDVILPEMLRDGCVYAEAYCEGDGYVILFNLPDRVTSIRCAMDYLYTEMVRTLEDMTGEKWEDADVKRDREKVCRVRETARMHGML